MSDLVKQFMEDSSVTDVTGPELLDITTLAQNQLDWENRIIQLESDLEHAKEAHRNICEYLLPEAMATCGMKEFKMLSGAKITVKEDVFASIRKDFIQQAVGWLDDNGLGGIVKDQVAVDFGRGELDSSGKLLEFCKANGMSASEKLSVHPMTLKATVKEMQAKGVEFPDEFFSVGPIRKAIIKVK